MNTLTGLRGLATEYLTRSQTCIKPTGYKIRIPNICHIIDQVIQIVQILHYGNQRVTFKKLPLIESFSALMMSMRELSRECMSKALGRSCNTSRHRPLLKQHLTTAKGSKPPWTGHRSGSGNFTPSLCTVHYYYTLFGTLKKKQNHKS